MNVFKEKISGKLAGVFEFEWFAWERGYILLVFCIHLFEYTKGLRL